VRRFYSLGMKLNVVLFSYNQTTFLLLCHGFFFSLVPFAGLVFSFFSALTMDPLQFSFAPNNSRGCRRTYHLSQFAVCQDSVLSSCHLHFQVKHPTTLTSVFSPPHPPKNFWPRSGNLLPARPFFLLPVSLNALFWLRSPLISCICPPLVF